MKRKVERFNDDGNLEQAIDFKLIQQMFTEKGEKPTPSGVGWIAHMF